VSLLLWQEVVSLVPKHRLVALVDFLGPEVQSSQNIGWPIKIEELHNRSNLLVSMGYMVNG